MSFMDGKPLEGSLELTKEGKEYFKKPFEIPDDIRKKAIDVYNYMAISQSGKIVFQFEDGIRFIMEIDTDQWKNIPRINLDEVLKGGANGSN